MPVRYRMFRGMLASWQALFDDAARFATELGPTRLISISHSEDKDDGVVAVWYWTKDGAEADDLEHQGRSAASEDELLLAPAGKRGAAQDGEWSCAGCGERNPANFEVCWNCTKPRDLA